MTEKLLESQADIFKALAHPVRLQILQMLKPGERCVCELVVDTEKEQPNISRHLAILKKDGILGCRKDGTRVMYWVRDRRAFELLDLCREMLKSYYQEKSEFF